MPRLQMTIAAADGKRDVAEEPDARLAEGWPLRPADANVNGQQRRE